MSRQGGCDETALDISDAFDELLQFRRFKRCQMIRPRQISIESEMLLDHRGAPRDGRKRDLDSQSVI